jgi:hypothetical protein
MLPILGFPGASTLAVVAVISQYGDTVPGYGNTMGGDMMANSFWILRPSSVRLDHLRSFLGTVLF